MSTSPGTKIGPYEIVGTLGAGGMGEVYRARDTKLGREVALKVLPIAFAADAERMGRFEREAKVLASLNQPNIATIHGLEDSGSTHALVMELVEGPTLADRIKQGAIPLDEALPIAKQIAEGLEYAHERGIVHRDLKPANIKVTPDDTVKILDFGLAKALEGDSASIDISSSPTISRMATQAGIILGTAAYMSPEQAKGKAVDRRTDIWSFGCVLYEILTGKQAFSGETVTDILAAVVRAEPDWSCLPAATPPAVRNLLARCLAKDARQRLQVIGEARIAIENQGAEATMPAALAAGAGFRSGPERSGLARALPWVLAALFAGIAASLALRYGTRPSPPAPAIVSQISAPPGQTFAVGGQEAGPPVLSPDGSKLAFAAIGPDGKQQLWVRPLAAATAQALAGTEGASYPFWSPDGRDLGFFAGGKLNRIDASGGPALTLCDAANGRGGSWGRDGEILFAPDILSPIYEVPSAGGTPKEVATVGPAGGASGGRWPQFLPDGKHFLFFHVENGGTYAGSVDGGEPRLIFGGRSNAFSGRSSVLYAPPGYLLFIQQGTLMAQRFDPERLRLSGDALPLVEGVAQNFIVFRGVFTVSDNGILAFAGGAASGGGVDLVWFDRTGKKLGQVGARAEYHAPRLSHDGTKLAVTVRDQTGNNLWIVDFRRGMQSPLTFSGNNIGAAWSPDDKSVLFESGRGSLFHLFQKDADGTGKSEPVVEDDANEYYPVWSADGRYVLFERAAAATPSHLEIWAMSMFGDRKPFPVIQASFTVGQPALSPDGKWLAYVSFESAKPEVYLMPFRGGSGRSQVSTNGGNWPEWRRDGKELYYMAPDDKLMAVDVSEKGGSFSLGKAHALFQTNYSAGPGWDYDVSADGKKFLVISQGEQRASQPLTLAVNWPALLKR